MLETRCKLAICIFCFQALSLEAHSVEYYVAAVYEHHAILNPNSTALWDRTSALDFMSRNLDIYDEQVIVAKEKVR
ncbi:hypothetical protein FKM82_006781 [Ascaphus truei]